MTTKAKALDRLIDAIAGEDVPMTSQTVAGRLDTLADTLAGDDVTFTARDIAGRISQLAGMIEDGTISIGGGVPRGYIPFYMFEVSRDDFIALSSDNMFDYIDAHGIEPTQYVKLYGNVDSNYDVTDSGVICSMVKTLPITTEPDLKSAFTDFSNKFSARYKKTNLFSANVSYDCQIDAASDAIGANAEGLKYAIAYTQAA